MMEKGEIFNKDNNENSDVSYAFLKEFHVNKYILLRLEGNLTVIWLNGKRFIDCKRLIINIPRNDIKNYDSIESIDEAFDLYDHYLIDNKIYKGENGMIYPTPYSYNIPPEVEFWAHCSNLQCWVENNDDTRMLHSNLAFPLLKKLTKAGDPIAKEVFKEEIAIRFSTKYFTTMLFLIEENYLDYLTNEEIEILLENNNDFTELFNDDQVKLEDILFYIFLNLKLENEKSDNSLKNECLRLVALGNYTQDPSEWHKVGLIFNSMDNQEFAKIFFKKVIELDPYFKGIWSHFGYGFVSYDAKKAMKYHLKTAELLVWVGKYYKEIGDMESSMNAYSQFYNLGKSEYIFDDYYGSYDNNKNFLEKLFDIEELGNLLRKIKNFLPPAIQNQFKEVFVWFGFKAANLWSYNDAIRYFELSLVFETDLSYEAWESLGWCYFKAEEYEKAIKTFKSPLLALTSIEGEFPETYSKVWTYIGNAYLKNSKFNDCINACKRAIKFYRKNPDPWFFLSQAFKSQKKRKKSRKAKKIHSRRFRLEKLRVWSNMSKRSKKRFSKRKIRVEQKEDRFFDHFLL